MFSATVARRFAALIFAALMAAILTVPAGAEERIHNFDTTIEVAVDGKLTITEDISVRAEAREIKRGIYRDIPLVFEDANGRRHKAGFEIVSILRDGKPEPYHVKRSGDGVRIYIGQEDVFLNPNTDYRYTITYETTRQIRFFDTYDEVYWNATGNEWIFPIDHASARVILPVGTVATKWAAYTGGYGSTGSDYKAVKENGGTVIKFETTRSFAPREGLTVAVAFPKGVVTPPTSAQEMAYFFQDYRAELIGGFGLVLILVYFVVAWWKVGRDPPKGVVFPRFEPPSQYSPALANYIYNRGFSNRWTALTAACLNLAVKGHLRMENLGSKVTLVETQDDAVQRNATQSALPMGEAVIKNWLGRHDGRLTIDKKNGTSISDLGSKFSGKIEGESRSRYFLQNWRFILLGGLLSVLTVAMLIIFGGLTEDEIVLVIPALLISVFFSVFVGVFGKMLWQTGSIAKRIGAILATFAVGLLMILMVSVLVFSGSGGPSPLPLLAVALVALNVLFFFLLGAPTALGRQAADEIEGLKMYLSVAEKERMNMAGAPEMSPSHFETLLPYAVALGVEKPWSEAFQNWLESAAGAAAAAAYSPGWYAGDRFDSHNISHSLNPVTSAMAGSFSSSLPAPKSSSSGSFGGGSSGGGGGGGGGGGW